MTRLSHLVCCGFSPSLLVGEGWGEGVAPLAKTKACASITTLSQTLPRQGGGGEKHLALHKSYW